MGIRREGDRLKPWDSLKLDALDGFRTRSRLFESTRGNEKFDALGLLTTTGVIASCAVADESWLTGLRAGTSNCPGVSIVGDASHDPTLRLWSSTGVALSPSLLVSSDGRPHS